MPIKMSLNETSNKVCTGKHLSHKFCIKNSIIQGDALSPLLLNITSEYALKNAQENRVGIKLNGTQQLQVCAHDANL
jgi:hypothetical protein